MGVWGGCGGEERRGERTRLLKENIFLSSQYMLSSYMKLWRVVGEEIREKRREQGCCGGEHLSFLTIQYPVEDIVRVKEVIKKMKTRESRERLLSEERVVENIFFSHNTC